MRQKMVAVDDFNLPNNADAQRPIFGFVPMAMEARNSSPLAYKEHYEDIIFYELVSDIGFKGERFRISDMGVQSLFDMEDWLIDDDEE